MFRRLLLASTAGFIIGTGALYAGAAWSQEARFVFRYASGVLPVAAGGSETENPDDGDDETGETDPNDDDEEGPTDPETPDEGVPVNGLTFVPTLILQDSNGNGYGDVGERVYLRTAVRNVSDQTISGIRFDYRISFGGEVSNTHNHSISLLPAATFEGATMVYLTATMLADLASGVEFEASASLTEIAGEPFPFETHAKSATIIPFGTYEPVQPSQIVVSAPTAAHLDADGDGYGDRGEIVRVSFSARNDGGLPAQGPSFEIAFPEWPSATAYCDRASLPASGSMSCSADIEITRGDLEFFGPPETVVSLNGSISLVSLNDDYFTAGEHSTALAPISFRVPPVTYAPHLRIVTSEGWEFQCATAWTAAFVAENQEMFLTRWDTGSRTVVAAGGNTVAGKTFSFQSTWILVSGIDAATGTASAYKNNMRSGDTRPAIPSSMPQPCGSNGKFNVVSHGDLTAAYPVVFESVEVVNLPM